MIKWTIRKKFATLLVVTTTAAAGALLYAVITMVERDKAAYVYNSNAAITEVLASEVETTLASTMVAIDLISLTLNSSSDLDTNERELIKAMFASNVNIVDLAVTRQSADKNPETILHLINPEFLAPYGLDRSFLDRLMTEPLAKEALLSTDRYIAERQFLAPEVPLLRLATQQRRADGTETRITAAIRNDKLSNILDKGGSRSVYLIDRTGDTIARSKHALSTDIDPEMLSLAKNVTGAFSGAREFRDAAGETLLISYARTADRALTVMTTMPAAAAFLASKQLGQMLLLVFGLIICLAIAASLIFSQRLTKALSTLHAACSRISAGDFTFRSEVRVRDEVGELAGAFETMSIKIGDLLVETAKKAELDRELATAKTVQSAFFRKTGNAQSGGLTVASGYLPANQCGGDWLGHFKVRDGLEVVIIGDATGHGVPAALVTAMAYTYFESLKLMLQESDQPTIRPSEILARMNKLVFGAFQGAMLMTVQVAVFDLNKRSMIIANAGHVFPMALIRDGSSSYADGATESICVRGSPVGAVAQEVFEDKVYSLDAWQRIVFYTDGLTESRSANQKQFGRRQLQKALVESRHVSADVLVTHLYEREKLHRHAETITDDIAIVVVEIPTKLGANLAA